MEKAKQVQKIIYDFTQLMGKPNRKANGSSHQWLFKRLTQEPLTIKEAISLPIERKADMYELLSQYIIFLSLFEDLQFPDGFTADSSEIVLGRQVLSYMAEHRWPFPQQVAH